MIATDQGLLGLALVIILIAHGEEHGRFKQDLHQIWSVEAVVKAPLEVHAVSCLRPPDNQPLTLGEGLLDELCEGHVANWLHFIRV